MNVAYDATYLKGTVKTLFGYISTAKYLNSQRGAALPCLTLRVEHFGVFQVLYKKSSYFSDMKYFGFIDAICNLIQSKKSLNMKIEGKPALWQKIL